MNRQQRPVTGREFKAWLAAGPVNLGAGEGLTVAAAKQAEKALRLAVPTVRRLGEVWFAKYILPR